MDLHDLGPWPRDENDAIRMQNELRSLISLEDHLHGELRTVMGVDVAYRSGPPRSIAAAVVLDASDLSIVQTSTAEAVPKFPYIPGLFALRELPALMDALRQVPITPDLILCDGHGLAHPRNFGLACHLGLLTDLPTIGVAKNLMVGTYTEPGHYRGARTPVKLNDTVVGYAVRTQAKVKPVFVSPGHQVSLDTAVELVLELSPRYRLPEPIRAADHQSRIAQR